MPVAFAGDRADFFAWWSAAPGWSSTGNCSGDPVNKLFDVITPRTILKFREAFLSGTAPVAAVW
jgi:hypothetical protein